MLILIIKLLLVGRVYIKNDMLLGDEKIVIRVEVKR